MLASDHRMRVTLVVDLDLAELADVLHFPLCRLGVVKRRGVSIVLHEFSFQRENSNPMREETWG